MLLSAGAKIIICKAQINHNPIFQNSAFRILPRHSPFRLDDGGSHFRILFYLGLDLFHIKTLDCIADFDIIEIFDANTAFITALNFFDVIFETTQ